MPLVLETFDKINYESELIEETKVARMRTENLSLEHIRNTKLLPNRQELLEKLPKRSIGAEIGVANGKFTSDILNYVNPQKLHLIDIWGSERYNDNLYQNVKNKFSKNIMCGQISIHRKLSLDAVNDFEDNYFDWIYIDTDHSYETTYQELKLYSKKMKSSGLILGHDYCMGNWTSRYKYGVIEAVHRFCVEQEYEILYLSMEISAQSFALKKLI